MGNSERAECEGGLAVTKEERLKAFQMRLDGETWVEIGKTLGYAHNTVQQDLKMVVCGDP